MTKIQLRETLNQYIKTGKLSGGLGLPTSTDYWDTYLDSALDLVTLDLAKIIPESFIVAENITLVADQNNYTLTAAWLQVWDFQKNVTGDNPVPITYLGVHERAGNEYVGQTDPEPWGWYYMGETICFVPTPSAAKTNYAKIFVIAKDAVTIPTAGPTYIPAIAQRLIPLKAAVFVALANGNNMASSYEVMYRQMLSSVEKVLSSRVQGQPRFLTGSQRNFGSTVENKDPYWD